MELWSPNPSNDDWIGVFSPADFKYLLSGSLADHSISSLKSPIFFASSLFDYLSFSIKLFPSATVFLLDFVIEITILLCQISI